MAHPIVLFDGVCNYCNGMVNFVIRHDKKAMLKFAALQSEAGQKILAEHSVDKEAFRSFILIENGKVWQRSDAAIRVVHYLPGLWRLLELFKLVPPFLRNGIYDFIAANRYRWFGKKDACMAPSAAQRERFL